MSTHERLERAGSGLAAVPSSPPEVAAADSALVVDDFAEFLDETYAPLVNVLVEAGASARVERVRSGEYALMVRGEGESYVDVTAAGRPLPPSPFDVTRWQLTTASCAEVLPGSTPLARVAQRILSLL